MHLKCTHTGALLAGLKFYKEASQMFSDLVRNFFICNRLYKPPINKFCLSLKWEPVLGGCTGGEYGRHRFPHKHSGVRVYSHLVRRLGTGSHFKDYEPTGSACYLCLSFWANPRSFPHPLFSRMTEKKGHSIEHAPSVPFISLNVNFLSMLCLFVCFLKPITRIATATAKATLLFAAVVSPRRPSAVLT